MSSAKNEGWNRGRLEKAVRERLPSEYRARAENIARTELGKLNSATKLSQFREVGISYYKWLTTIDGRERDSHRSMNGLICSVSNPDVYYTENPEDPLHPVEHPRTAGMFHGNPGEDFQCRCSMVAWDPEIDGSYEVKESPEKPEAEQGTEKFPEPSPETAETARLKADLEKSERERAEAENALKNSENEKRKAERKLEVLRKANTKHAARTQTEISEIRERFKQRRERDAEFASLVKKAKSLKIPSLPVRKNSSVLPEDEIISKLAGGDLTRGSCASLALAYVGQKAGFDVLDFRGGASQDFFSLNFTLRKILKIGGFVETDYNGFNVASNLLGHVKPGKEYYFSCGEHAAIIRKANVGFEYLELQSRKENKNGFHKLTRSELKDRFSVKKSSSSYGYKMKQSGELIDIEKLKNSTKFKELLEFINTEPSKQLKGASGRKK